MRERPRPSAVPKTPALVRASLVATLAGPACGSDDDGDDMGGDATVAPMFPTSTEPPMADPTLTDSASASASATTTGTTTDDSSDPTEPPMADPTDSGDTSSGDTSTTTDTGADSTSGASEGSSTTAIPPMPGPIEPGSGEVR